MIHSDLRKRALGDFLRRHRESVAKPAGDNRVGERRRRTSGLRREEVAEMAGISPTWYARLEQGKEATPSGAALGRIADVLRLAPAERAYLFQVARRVDPNDASNFADALVNKTIESCVLSVSHPACVLDEYWTPLSWNAAWADLFAPWLKGPEKNLLRYVFLDLGARTFVVDWELRARRLLAQFRVDYGKYIEDPKMLDLVRELSEESDLFQRIWREQKVLFWDGNEKSYNHPHRGLLKFFQTTFLAAADPALKLIILEPCSEVADHAPRSSDIILAHVIPG
jgi:transcriptional regulator with XRE-family HTH domain